MSTLYAIFLSVLAVIAVDDLRDSCKDKKATKKHPARNES